MDANSKISPLSATFPRPKGALPTICEDREYHTSLHTYTTTTPSLAPSGMSPVVVLQYLTHNPDTPSPRSYPRPLRMRTPVQDAAVASPFGHIEHCGVSHVGASPPLETHTPAHDAAVASPFGQIEDCGVSPVGASPPLETHTPAHDAAFASPFGHIERRGVASPAVTSPSHIRQLFTVARDPTVMARLFATPQHRASPPLTGASSQPPQPNPAPPTYTGPHFQPAPYSPLSQIFSKTAQFSLFGSPLLPLASRHRDHAEHEDSGRDRRGVVRRARESQVGETPTKKQRRDAADSGSVRGAFPDWYAAEERRHPANRSSCLSPAPTADERGDWCMQQLSMATASTPPPPRGDSITQRTNPWKFESPTSTSSNSPVRVRADSPSVGGDPLKTPLSSTLYSYSPLGVRADSPPLGEDPLKTPQSSSMYSNSPLHVRPDLPHVGGDPLKTPQSSSMYSYSPLHMRPNLPPLGGDPLKTPQSSSLDSDTRLRPDLPSVGGGTFKTPTSPRKYSDSSTHADSSSPRLLSPVDTPIRSKSFLARIRRVYGNDGCPRAPVRRRKQRTAPSATVSGVQDEFDNDNWWNLYS